MNINQIINQIENAQSMDDVFYLADAADAVISEAAEAGSYPRFGYTTEQVFETAEAWEAWKRAELAEAVADAKARLSE
jgi:hypothetical protein